MKKVLITTFILINCFTIKAQSTTASEYNYIVSSNGLLFDAQGSREIKKGYTLTNLDIQAQGTWTDGYWRRIRVFSFNRQGLKVALVVEFMDKDNKQSYRCIPTGSSAQEIINLSDASFRGLSNEWNYVLAIAFRTLAMRKLL